MAASTFIFAALFVAVAAAASDDYVFIDGKCPDVNVVQNFDVAAYAGKWYEFSKYPIGEEAKGNCGTAEYTPNGDVVKVKNSRVVNGVQNVIEGIAKLAGDANGSGKLEVTFNFGTSSRTSQLSVLATNYKNYALAYSCNFDAAKNKSKVYVWVLSRSKTLEGDAKTGIDAALKAANLDANKLIKTDLSEEACKFTKTVEITKPSA